MTNPRIPYRLSSARPKLPDFQDKKILVHFVVNVEHWQFESAMPRTIITPPHGKETIPDVPNFSWADYGMRAGMPRLLELLDGIPASTSINAGVIDAYPSAAEAMLKAGWEFIGHGMHQKATNHVEGGEEQLITACLDKIEKFTGARPRGWLSPGLRETVDSPDLMKKAGLDYVCDWVVDDLPSWMTTKHGPLLAMPYNLEVNDSIIYAVERHATGEMLKRLLHTLRRFETETSDNPRVLAIGLHPHLISVPHRIHELDGMIELLRASDQTVFTTGSAICDWFSAAQTPEA
ncbi:polysaccharide deacetylase family protein [Tardiphaga sp.]|jgi:allantoinase|uniref:polysaccharide deacetylase family protein n=1 Tax=Tardiphaga sp. TaxID=1926292 RepID=UPI0019B7D5F1|nr:polysaccharide deacetylase family protein [Tardiphaga sp.]MBC7581055.1 polysaccharide deacetylase family protein [Tardiphaga sp.]